MQRKSVPLGNVNNPVLSQQRPSIGKNGSKAQIAQQQRMSRLSTVPRKTLMQAKSNLEDIKLGM